MKQTRGDFGRLTQWLRAQRHSEFLSPLPCREEELTLISDFLTQAFRSECPAVMTLSGRKNTGKTSAMRLSIAMSDFEKQILMIDCKNSTPLPPFDASEKKMLVFDHFQRPIILFANQFSLNYFAEKHPDITLLESFDI